MVTVDLHTHSRFFHGFSGRPTAFDPLGARLLVAVAKWHDLDAIAVTNHDYYSQFDIDTGDVTVIPGIEISTTDGHVLVIGPNPPARTTAGTLTPEEAIDIAHDRGCAAIVAHPFRNSSVRKFDLPFDAYEVNGKRSVAIDHLQQLANSNGLPLVGGSDAHYPFEVGRAYTEIEAEEATPEAVVDAVLDGRVEYQLNESLSTRLIGRLYKLIHQYKGHTSG